MESLKSELENRNKKNSNLNNSNLNITTQKHNNKKTTIAQEKDLYKLTFYWNVRGNA